MRKRQWLNLAPLSITEIGIKAINLAKARSTVFFSTTNPQSADDVELVNDHFKVIFLVKGRERYYKAPRNMILHSRNSTEFGVVP